MFDFQQRRKIRSIFYHRATLIILGIIVLFAVHSTFVVYQKKINTEKMKVVSSERVIELENRNKELMTQINELQTTQGVEAEIRSKFTVAKPNEHMVIVLDGPLASTTPPENDGFWQSLKALFGKKKR